MNKKLLYLTNMSIKKKIKTKWFLVANIILFILIVGLLNIDSVIKLFGGDFDDITNIYILDESSYGVYDDISLMFENYNDYLDFNYKIIEASDYDSSYKEVENDSDNNTIMLLVNDDDENYMKATLVSNKDVYNSLLQIINSSLNSIKSNVALDSYGIDNDTMNRINSAVIVDRVRISEDSTEEENMDFMMSVIFPILLLPVFMLSMFLVQMIGAEINEEKTTKSMEIIISNVSPKTHFLSKLIAGNLFVLVQGVLIILYAVIGVVLRFMVNGSMSIASLIGNDNMAILDSVSSGSMMSNLWVIIIPTFILIIMSFIGYSLLSAILASMTTNMEDYQQVQTPIVFLSLIGYYLAMMASLFNGSVFIRVFSYIPFISTLLAPALLMLGQISIIDVIISIILMGGTLFVLIRYGLRIYKVGILNYSSSNIWKRMFKAVKNK